MKLLVHAKRAWHPIWFVSLGLLLIIIILPLTRQGMFMDGVFYAAIAKNLSLGYGTIWQPFYSLTDFPVFYEHPPLAIYFQSLFFKLLGQGFGVEQFYSFLMAIGQFTLISCYWIKKERSSVWHLGLLLFLWLLIPLNHLYTVNHLEGTLTLFTTSASLLLLVTTQSKPAAFAQYLISSTAIIIAFFCNGPTAFFPLVVPFINEMFNEKHSISLGIQKTIYLTLLTALGLMTTYLLIPEALNNSRMYIEQQLLNSITGTRRHNYVEFNYLHILYFYFRAYGLVSASVGFCFILAAKINDQHWLNNLKKSLKEKNFLLFLVLSLISSLPVGISHTQAFNYIMQSAPFFTLAMMWLCFEPFKVIAIYCETKKHLFTQLFRASYILFAISLVTVLSLANGFNRHQAMIEDINYLTHYIKGNTIISTSSAIYLQWYTGAYFARNSMISMTEKIGNHYYLALKNGAIPKDYHRIDLPLSYYDLAIMGPKKLRNSFRNS